MIDFPTSGVDPAASAPVVPRVLTAAPAPPSSASSPTPDEVRARRKELERLGDEIARLSAHIQAAIFRLLELIRSFDQSEGWHEEGFRSCAQWLSWRTGVGPGAAREKVRVARALGDLPKMSGALWAGELSYSAARALTRVATPENEAELVEVAHHTTAADLERLVGSWRAADRSEGREREKGRHVRRALWVVPDADGGWRIRGRLDPEVGAVLRKALEAAGEALHGREAADPQCPAEARRADALGLVAEAALGGGLGAGAEEVAECEAGEDTNAAPVVGRAERFQVVVHVSAETLAEGAAATDRAEAPRIAGGPRISAETARRLTCDAALVGMTHDSEESVLDVGRRRRTVPPALRRALDHRDGGCRFPGCHSRFCDAHHVRPWAEGGETTLDNLVLLCRRHHRRVHEDGWRVRMDERGEACFYRPDGQRMPRVSERPAAPAHPVTDLERRHRSLAIDPWTPTPRWTGERMDVDWALFTLRRPALPHVSAET